MESLNKVELYDILNFTQTESPSPKFSSNSNSFKKRLSISQDKLPLQPNELEIIKRENNNFKYTTYENNCPDSFVLSDQVMQNDFKNMKHYNEKKQMSVLNAASELKPNCIVYYLKTDPITIEFNSGIEAFRRTQEKISDLGENSNQTYRYSIRFEPQ